MKTKENRNRLGGAGIAMGILTPDQVEKIKESLLDLASKSQIAALDCSIMTTEILDRLMRDIINEAHYIKCKIHETPAHVAAARRLVGAGMVEVKP